MIENVKSNEESALSTLMHTTLHIGPFGIAGVYPKKKNTFKHKVFLKCLTTMYFPGHNLPVFDSLKTIMYDEKQFW